MFSMGAWTAASCSLVVRRNLFVERQPASQPVAFLQNWPLLRPISPDSSFQLSKHISYSTVSLHVGYLAFKMFYLVTRYYHSLITESAICRTTWIQLLSDLSYVAMRSFIFSKKLKQSRYTPRRALGGRRYSSCSFFTLALDGVSGQRYTPSSLYSQGKDPRYPLYRRLGGPQSRSGHRG
jgi:hypothetical protein